MIQRRFFLLPLVLAAAGCAGPQPASTPVRVAKASEVGQCTYVMDLHDTVNVGTTSTPDKALAFARQAMIREAARGGANTIVFGTARPTTLVPAPLTATAYRCPG
jgi:hypothetical protein